MVVTAGGYNLAVVGVKDVGGSEPADGVNYGVFMMMQGCKLSRLIASDGKRQLSPPETSWR